MVASGSWKKSSEFKRAKLKIEILNCNRIIHSCVHAPLSSWSRGSSFKLSARALCLAAKKEAKLRGWDAIRLSDGSKEILFVCTRDNYAINHFLITISFSFSVLFQIFNFQLTWAASRKTTRFCRRISYNRSTDDSWFSIDRLQCVLMDNTIGILMYVVTLLIYYLFSTLHCFSFRFIHSNLTRSYSKLYSPRAKRAPI